MKRGTPPGGDLGGRQMTIYHLRVDTPSFTFDAYGQTVKATKAALCRAFRKHIRQTGASREYFFDDIDTLTPQKVELGAAYRDGEKM